MKKDLLLSRAQNEVRHRLFVRKEVNQINDTTQSHSPRPRTAPLTSARGHWGAAALIALTLWLAASLALAQDNAPQPVTGLLYFAVEDLDNVRAAQRGTAGSAGVAFNQLILAPNTRYRIWLLEAATLRVADVALTTPDPGQQFEVPPLVLHTTNAADSDGDALSSIGEFILGTDSNNPDTDGDGIFDGAEVQQGTDPLSGKAVRTGVIATADTPGTAVDIFALNDMAIVADSDQGVSVFNVFNGMNPTIVAQVNTPGNAQAVAGSGNFIAVADGVVGLAIIDISNPPAARLVSQIGLDGTAQAVTASGGVAYVGTSTGQLLAVELASGTALKQINVGESVQDLALAGDTLFVLLPFELRAYGLSGESLAFLGNAATSNFRVDGITNRKRLFVGRGIAYATSFPGYDTLDVSNPSAMQRIGAAQDVGPNSFKQIVANGSGLGLAPVGANPQNDGTHHLSLYDVSDPTQTTQFITTVETPGIARAVSLYNGLAYVADSAAGLQVVNYLAFDTQGVAPSITLSASFPLDPAQAEEGKRVRISADVSDDVQVRNVEFYIDGVKVATDGNFPFEHRFVTPPIAQARFTLRARASDTGGNATWTDEIGVALTPDATAPQVITFTPQNNAILGSVTMLFASFNEPIDPTTLTTETFQVLDTNAGDAPVPGGSISYRDEINTAVLTFSDGLPSSQYRVVISPSVTDVAGNPLAEAFTSQFLAFSAADRDNDGVPDDVEPLLGLHPDNPDSDGDGIADGNEDFDNDGLANAGEIVLGDDPANADTDGDGIADGAEDTDSDGLSNGEEIARGTNPFLVDTDRDGFNDSEEVTNQSDPTDRRNLPVRDLVISIPLRNTTPPGFFESNLTRFPISTMNTITPGFFEGDVTSHPVSAFNSSAPDAMAGETQGKVVGVENLAP